MRTRMSTTAVAASNLICLVYVSSATRLLSDEELVEILRVSRENNAKLGITGMLLYRDGNFMQVLEGPEAEVRALASRIAQDPRHRGFLKLLAKPCSERQWPEWCMAFRKLDDLAPEDREAFSPFLSSSLLDEEFVKNPNQSYRLLTRFKQSLR